MTGSVALDVVIGLVFIYLLYSLLATVVCEIIANYLGLRARNLLYAIQRMLEDNPESSEGKFGAFLKQIADDISRLFNNPEGPAACVFYRLPIIKYLAKNTFFSKPAYITKQTFSKAIFEIFRRYGGGEEKSDLEKIQNVLTGAVEYTGILRTIKDEIVNGTKPDPSNPKLEPDYVKIFDTIKQKATVDNTIKPRDAGQLKLFNKILGLLESIKKKDGTEKKDLDKKKDIVYDIDEMLNLFGHETRSHLSSLLKESNNDLVKFKLHLEQWFDDTMDRATGWYKQKIQFLLLLIGLTFAVSFNANTLAIIHILSVDQDARDKMVQLASNYVHDPANTSTPDSAKEAKLDSLQLDSIQKTQAKLQKQLEEANSLLGMGWPDLPDSLPLLALTPHRLDSVRKLEKDGFIGYSIIELDTLIKPDTLVKIDTLFIKNKLAKVDTVIKMRLAISGPSDNKKILVYSGIITKGILGCLSEGDSELQNPDRYIGFNKKANKINVENGGNGDFRYLISNFFSYAFWGYLLTAVAISLGAPFWFDLLSKLMQIRGVLREPTKSQGGEATASASVSDPAHLVNRKG